MKIQLIQDKKIYISVLLHPSECQNYKSIINYSSSGIGGSRNLYFRTMGSAEYQPLLLGLDSHSRIPDLSSIAIEEFLEHRPVAVRWWPRLVGWESRLLWLLSGASIVVSIFNYMLSFVTLMFTGHLGSLELAGASIASVGIQGLAYGIMVRFP